MTAAYQPAFDSAHFPQWYIWAMAQKFGSLYRDKKTGGVWWVLEFWIEGKRYRLRGFPMPSGKLVKFPNEEAARVVLDGIRSEIRNGADPLTAITPFLQQGATYSTVEHHYKAFCQAKATDPSVKLSRQRVVELRGHLERGHLAEIQTLPVQTLSYAQLDDWTRALFDRTELGANSIHHIVCDVRTFLRWAERRGIIRQAPEVPVVRVSEYVPNIPTPAEVARVLEAIPWRPRGVILARALMGLRPGEARDANVADYRLDPSGEEDVLTVRRSKSNRYRLLSVPAPLAAWVREFRPIGNVRDTDWEHLPLFDNPNAHEGGRWSPSSDRRLLKAAMKACGVNYRPNEFTRHAYGTHNAQRLLADKHTAPDVMRRMMASMGHTEPRTSAQYIRLAPVGLE